MTEKGCGGTIEAVWTEKNLDPLDTKVMKKKKKINMAMNYHNGVRGVSVIYDGIWRKKEKNCSKQRDFQYELGILDG